MQHFLKDLMIIFSGMAFHAADTHRATSEGAALLIFPVSVNSRAESEIILTTGIYFGMHPLYRFSSVRGHSTN